ncbi:gas vesicle protein GvpL [Halalkalicoccus jeotgali]|uniref:Gas vesicle synthesis GvpLGvpF n=1 Tax=Halalkalicoccus jeotgali (strain DSM 18796 / CECT 7217 / JCM 14584 / KCTC 4019 / B3) TaxID=795797 RepID=D8J5P6_HALJB|nr:GvpL/GvpF family gas vesicle protein [Halalkalicoccus jeotgali]ADJ15742.1 Gas vesicle synthesis GvpLGvpF [Halalkalicoccus jeotgali B3]ELY37234.1 Gas vesicle synthesis GvpLGvpF [Halalkalicoccus jeotgali B3]
MSTAGTEFEVGRYLYCAVRADDDPSISVAGIEDGEVRIVTAEGIGAVVQPVEAMFDSDDLTEVRRWLLSHQRVVDAVGESFDTPVPFRFDTVIKGDDERVENWITENATQLEAALESLSGCWEYRIELRWDESRVREEIARDDEELAALQARIDDASEGTGYLLEKQYEQHLTERLQGRRDDLAGQLYDRVAEHARAVETAGNQSTLLGADGTNGSDDGFETVIELSVLAPEDHEGVIGDVLEEFIDRDGFDVNYTGPWPPYSHAPTIGDGGEG